MERVHDPPSSDRDQRDALEKLQVRLKETRAAIERARQGEEPPELGAAKLEVEAATRHNTAAKARGLELQHAVEAAGRTIEELREAQLLAIGRERRAEETAEIRRKREVEAEELAEWDGRGQPETPGQARREVVVLFLLLTGLTGFLVFLALSR